MSVVERLKRSLEEDCYGLLDSESLDQALVSFLNFETRKQVSLSMVTAIVEDRICLEVPLPDAQGSGRSSFDGRSQFQPQQEDRPLNSVEDVKALFNFISPLVKDEDWMPSTLLRCMLILKYVECVGQFSQNWRMCILGLFQIVVYCSVTHVFTPYTRVSCINS